MRLASISQLCSAIHRLFWDVAWGAGSNKYIDGVLLRWNGVTGASVTIPPRSINPASSGRLGYSRAQPTAAFPGPAPACPLPLLPARPPAQCVVCICLPNEGGYLVGRGVAGFATWGSLGELFRRGPSIPPALVASATAARRPPPLSPAPRPRSPCHCCRPPACSMRAGAVVWNEAAGLGSGGGRLVVGLFAIKMARYWALS
ncbi:hypothetical protein B0H14DRAFT_2603799 [Mycena olivaceomarginata]|nr:hypothetical protein B0H14DRAFT_2603799 [Mycena olivaceomarginata]